MKLVVRADGDAAIGTGHIIRCMALAEAWKGPVTFACRSLHANLGKRIEDAGHTVEMLNTEADLATLDMDRLVLDGYSLPHAHQSLAPSLVVDDGARVGHYGCTLVTDPNPAQDPRPYEADGARALVGPQYALVRSEYALQRPRTPGVRDGPLLISLGGNASLDTWRQVLDGVQDADIVLGAAQEHRQAIQNLAPHARFHHDLPSLAPLLAKARLAILAGGSTNWEACVTGTPRLLLSLADNQEQIVEHLVHVGAAKRFVPGVDLREILEDEDALNQMAQAGWQMCDGKGAQRVAAELA